MLCRWKMGAAFRTNRAQAAKEPPETGAEAALEAVTRACAPGGPAAGDRRLANLILGDVAAIAGAGRPPVVCALTDAHRLIVAAAAAAAAPTPPEAESTPHPVAPQAAAPARQRSGVRRPAPPVADSGAVPGAGVGGSPMQQGSSDSRPRRRGPAQSQAQSSDRRGGAAGRHARRQLRVAELQLGGFLLPWANEQPPAVFVAVATAASDEWERWRCAPCDSQHPQVKPGCWRMIWCHATIRTTALLR